MQHPQMENMGIVLAIAMLILTLFYFSTPKMLMLQRSNKPNRRRPFREQQQKTLFYKRVMQKNVEVHFATSK